MCLRCVVSSPSVVRHIKVGWRWSRSKGVVMNSFYLSRNSKSAIRGHQFIAVVEGISYFPEHYRFYGNRNELRDFSLVTHNSENSLFFFFFFFFFFFSNNTTQRKFLFAALRRFVFGAARLVVFRLVGCLRRNGLARCCDGSVSLDVWGKYSRPPCSFVCLVFVESRRYLH